MTEIQNSKQMTQIYSDIENLVLWDRRRSRSAGVRGNRLCRYLGRGVMEYWNVGILKTRVCRN